MRTGGARLGVIVNPTAGHGRGRRRGAEAIAELARRGFSILDLSGPSAAAAMANARGQRSEYDALLVVGGDGMAHLGINVVAGTHIPLGLIPVGSGNDFARHLRLPVHQVPAAVDAFAAALDRGPQPIDAIRLSPAPGAAWAGSGFDPTHRWAGCVVSVGFDSMVNARANSYRWPRGMGRYLRGVLRELTSFLPYPYRLRLNGDEHAFRGALVALANTPSFGGGMKIAPGARVTSGTIDIVTAGEISKWQLLRVFPKVFSGGHLSHPAVRVFQATEVQIEANGGKIPEIFADGEWVGAAPMTARVHPGAVQMLCPRLEA